MDHKAVRRLHPLIYIKHQSARRPNLIFGEAPIAKGFGLNGKAAPSRSGILKVH
jgi:hypothetical protein